MIAPYPLGMIAAMFRATLIAALLLAGPAKVPDMEHLPETWHGQSPDTIPNVYIPGLVLATDDCTLEEPLNILPGSWDHILDVWEGIWEPMIRYPYYCWGDYDALGRPLPVWLWTRR